MPGVQGLSEDFYRDTSILDAYGTDHGHLEPQPGFGPGKTVRSYEKKGWTDDRVARLKELWAEGLSASQIVERLGHVTRNAVIGKIHRLGLSGGRATDGPLQDKLRNARRKRSTERRSELRKKSKKDKTLDLLKRYGDKPEAPKALPQPRPTDIPHVSSLTDLEASDCKWPIDHDKGIGFCGCPRAEGSSYCEHHHIRATTDTTAAYQAACDEKRVGNPLNRQMVMIGTGFATADEVEEINIA